MDADTWLNQERLSKAEDHNEVLGIGPSLTRGEESNQRLSFAQILNKLG